MIQVSIISPELLRCIVATLLQLLLMPFIFSVGCRVIFGKILSYYISLFILFLYFLFLIQVILFYNYFKLWYTRCKILHCNHFMPGALAATRSFPSRTVFSSPSETLYLLNNNPCSPFLKILAAPIVFSISKFVWGPHLRKILAIFAIFWLQASLNFQMWYWWLW